MAGHRATSKKSNKGFKSGHASKRSLKAASKGKVEKSIANNKSLKAPSKLERKNFMQQLKKNKILKTLNERSLFKNSQTERIITIIPLTSNISGVEIANKLLGSLDDENLSIVDEVSVTTIRVARFKSNLKIIIPNMKNFISILDAAKIADFVIFGLSATEEVEPAVGEQIIRAVETQGISTAFGVIPDLITAYPKRNLQMDVLKSLTSYYNHFFPNNEKLFALENQTESVNLLRTLCQKFPKSVTWRDSRGYLVADSVDWSPSIETPIEGSLIVEGFARGIGFHPNRLVHLPGLGDFKINRIEKIVTIKNKGDLEMVDENENIYTPDLKQDTLEELLPIESEDDEDIDLDDEDEEQDWSNNQNNYNEGSFNDFGEKLKPKRLPKGISEYQARWMLEEDINELIEENGVESESELDLDNQSDEMDYGDDGMDLEDDGKSTYAPTEMHVDLTNEEEQNQLKAYKQREREELEFPDEIELNPHESAKKRLARYRGVKSLANCNWDYDEYDDKRPTNWDRYLRVRDYKSTKARLQKEARNEAIISPGERCRIYISVPSYVIEKITNPKQSPFVLYSLLEHEHKVSVCNFTIQTWEDYEKPIKSKENIIVQYGPRRVMIQPLFNQATHNPNKVTKFQRFLHPGNISIATAVTPVLFTNAPALFFKASADGSVELLGQGSFLNPDHTRVLAKRIFLTGEIFKIHKSVVTIRYMFFNSDDVNEYKSIPIFTKMGRSGLIKESLGTHGYFKAKFDGTLNAQDIVGMALYKRVWPRECITTGI
ncbi:hypothetical protein CANARDRAFT_29602 [[Candida] arabinofermentans NRRL YB-2248]|uniref:Bms1-type G domain-containing protein n=1 Tax=[Candida] arabinofermentans NRRL YB-2248 TaxID=983967 RepID=A0A1E4SWQ0_9ASCO|nr:hypothetical protein CANARDRAFT_29602 [[Candida] arabinofermentans NRRL YB-2248]